MTTPNSINAELIQQWLSEKLQPSEVMERIKATGVSDFEADTWLQEYKKLRRGNKQITGFIVTGAGALIGLASCIITLMHQSSSHFGFTLFGLTTIAALLIFYGLYLIFE